ncbi:DUF3107 domain-containing protein [Cellulomonas bogoriensis]|uniref:ATP-binding protein n=1 Tax=Cellulomonas bogoriensis 69B4 = DSM 16987 TaxID=1386082 RepID=A0A0A0BKP3_9CELL|nr:DUF3107 domain-containing protein [Cellulomonas bogoriensis]KGM09098.1 ATP-binding protein [Cellulomonas bogoriensis 69B4 = DSM 16987]
MEITIGVQNVARELVVETDRPAEQVAAEVLKTLESGGPLDLTDSKGRRVIVPAATLGYVELGGDEARKVGIHSI